MEACVKVQENETICSERVRVFCFNDDIRHANRRHIQVNIKSSNMIYGNTPAYQTLFGRYDNAQGAMGTKEFHNFWLMSFDSNHDSRITAKEFRDHWISNHLPHTDHALLFFMEMDVNHDTVINLTDLDLLFPVFDKNEDGYIENDEFYTVWDALFDDVLDLHNG